jgi:hypothetical protein
MKNNAFFLIILFFCFSTFWMSCDKSDMQTTASKNVLTNSPGLDKSSASHLAHLNYLHNDLDPNQIQTRDTRYSIQDVLDLLNDGMNHLYCRPTEFRNKTVSFTDVFSVPKTSGEVSEGDLVNLMDDIALFAGDNYYDDGGSNKQPLMFNMTESSGPSPSYFYIEATFIMEVDLPPTGGDNYPYSTDWKFGQFGGDVTNLCNSENVNLDAVDLFRRDLRAQLTHRESHEHYYFKNPYAVCFTGLPNSCGAVEIEFSIPPSEYYSDTDLLNGSDGTPGDNLYDYLIFYNYSGNSNFHTCISDDEMNFYYVKMHDMATGILPYPLGNNVLVQIEVGYDLLTSGSSTIFHSMIVTRATKVEVEEEDVITALPCTIDC